MFEFDATLWRHSGQAAWHFVTLPFDVSDDIEARQRRHIAFGSVRVEATVGASRWSTSLFPDKSAQAYLLPVKKAFDSWAVASCFLWSPLRWPAPQSLDSQGRLRGISTEQSVAGFLLAFSTFFGVRNRQARPVPKR